MIKDNLDKIKKELPRKVCLVAVSKTKPVEMILEAYEAGQRVFGENRALELEEKHKKLPKDIEWHMIGHLQRNKVKFITPFISLIHGVDSEKLLKEINKEAAKNNRVIDVLLQVHIAKEENKFGFSENEIIPFLESETLISLKNIKVRGLMGMATFSENKSLIESEFKNLKALLDSINSELNIQLDILSMGMSGDYRIAIECGSNMVRIGSSIFGLRS